jgi:ribosomal protein L37AE/L43A
MHLKYVHFFGNESIESILEANGLKPKLEDINKLKPVSCPNCGELNKIDSKFCVKCRMVLSYGAYTEAVEESAVQKSRLDRIEAKIQKLESKHR